MVILSCFFLIFIYQRELLGWAILFNFLVPVSLPVPLYYTGCFMCFTTFFGYYALIYMSSRDDPMFNEMVIIWGIYKLQKNVVLILYMDFLALSQYGFGIGSFNYWFIVL